MNKVINFFEKIDIRFLADATQDPGQMTIHGEKHWIYYLFGAIFLVLTLLSLWYTWRIRNSKKEYETIAVSFSLFKKFWYEHRFAIMILVTVILLIISISFFTLNSVIVPSEE